MVKEESLIGSELSRRVIFSNKDILRTMTNHRTEKRSLALLKAMFSKILIGSEFPNCLKAKKN